MTIGAWVLLGIGVVVAIAAIALACYSFYESEVATGIAIIVIGLIVAVAMIIGPIVYSKTEAGKRALKDQQSNFNEGIQRTVRVYDIEGDLIETYTGKFDIETDNDSYIIFDDESGKRHIIYFSTATVLIDEE